MSDLLTSVADVPARSALRASSSGDLVVRGHVDESATGLSLYRRTASMEQAVDTAEAAAVDHYVSSSTENILFQSANGHRGTD